MKIFEKVVRMKKGGNQGIVIKEAVKNQF